MTLGLFFLFVFLKIIYHSCSRPHFDLSPLGRHPLGRHPLASVSDIHKICLHTSGKPIQKHRWMNF